MALILGEAGDELPQLHSIPHPCHNPEDQWGCAGGAQSVFLVQTEGTKAEHKGSAACPRCGQVRAMGMKNAGQGREREEKQWAHQGYLSKQRGCCFGHRTACTLTA